MGLFESGRLPDRRNLEPQRSCLPTDVAFRQDARTAGVAALGRPASANNSNKMFNFIIDIQRHP